jgi:hypothetical protein
MSIFLRILPALALACSLSPLAAQAHSADAAKKITCVSAIMTGSATIDNPTIIYGGVGINSFPDSFGG